MRVDRARIYCVIIVLDLAKLNRLEVIRDPAFIDTVATVLADVEKDVELAISINNTNVPNLKSKTLVRFEFKRTRLRTQVYALQLDVCFTSTQIEKTQADRG